MWVEMIILGLVIAVVYGGLAVFEWLYGGWR